MTTSDKNLLIDDLLGRNGFGAKTNAIEDIMQAIDFSLNPLEVCSAEPENNSSSDLLNELLIEGNETIYHSSGIN